MYTLVLYNEHILIPLDPTNKETREDNNWTDGILLALKKTQFIKDKLIVFPWNCCEHFTKQNQ